MDMVVFAAMMMNMKLNLEKLFGRIVISATMNLSDTSLKNSTN